MSGRHRQVRLDRRPHRAAAQPLDGTRRAESPTGASDPANSPSPAARARAQRLDVHRRRVERAATTETGIGGRPIAAPASSVPSARRTASSTTRSKRPPIAKPHLGLGGVHVHVHRVGRDDDIEEERRPDAGRNRGLVGGFGRANDAVVAYGAAVHGDEHAAAGGADVGGPLHEAGHARRAAHVVHIQQALGVAAAPQRRQAGAERRSPAGSVMHVLAVVGDGQAHVPPRERHAGEGVDDGAPFRPRAAHELEPGRRVVEELRNRHRRAAAARRLARFRRRFRRPPARACRRRPPGRSRSRAATPSRWRGAPRRGTRSSRPRPDPARRGSSTWRGARARAPRLPRPIPMPSSLTRMRRRPPSSTSSSIAVAPASSAFSTSSLTTDAGRSTTSPAAIWSATALGRTAMRGAPDAAVSKGADIACKLPETRGERQLIRGRQRDRRAVRAPEPASIPADRRRVPRGPTRRADVSTRTISPVTTVGP